MGYATTSPLLKEMLAAGMARFSADGNSIIKPDGTTWGSKVAKPTISPEGGESGPAILVTLATDTAEAKIYYTINGDPPTSASTLYSVPFSKTVTGTVKAIAIKAGSVDSDVASAAFVINGAVATPTFSPVAGAVADNTPVTISTVTAGASIFYTTNGDTPTAASTPYTGPVIVTDAMTIKAIATKPLFSNSAVGQAAYTIAP